MSEKVVINTVAELRTWIGKEVAVGKWITVTQDLIDKFAEASGDYQWIHVDVERCERESPFGGPIAHGFLTLSLVPRLAGGGLRVTGHTNAINYGAESLRFLAPVPAGSKVHGRTRVVRAEAKSGGTLVTSELDARVVGAEKPSILYRLQVLYRG